MDFDKVFLMEVPYNFKQFQRSTLRQQLLDRKNRDESNEIIVNSGGGDDDNSLEMQTIHKKLDAQVLQSAVLRKRNTLGLFYKRVLTLTDEPKLFYCREPKDNASVHKLKQIVLNPDSVKLERLDKTKFRIQD